MNKRKPLSNTHMKFIDDLTLASSINLKENLIENPGRNLTRPLTYHERTEQSLPYGKDIIYQQFEKLKTFADKNEMKINEEKTKVMVFNTGKKYDFLPKIETETGDMLEVVEEIKLLGIMVQSDMKWQSNTNYLCGKGFARLWILRNLKKFGASHSDLIDVYNKQCRSILELAVPAW